MFSLFLILFLIVTIFGIVSVIKPGTNKKTGEAFKRKDLGIGFGLFAVIFLVLVFITAPPQKTINLQQTSNKTSTHTSTDAGSQSEPQTPAVTTKQETETQSVPYATQDQNDSSLAKGQTKVAQQGQNGTDTLTYNVTYTNGVQTSKALASTTVTTPATNEIVDVGTYVAPTPTPTQSSTPAPAQSCYPLSDEDTCYEPGEYCRDSDQGTSGLAGDGESITCEDNDGWRWEPN